MIYNYKTIGLKVKNLLCAVAVLIVVLCLKAYHALRVIKNRGLCMKKILSSIVFFSCSMLFSMAQSSLENIITAPEVLNLEHFSLIRNVSRVEWPSTSSSGQLLERFARFGPNQDIGNVIRILEGFMPDVEVLELIQIEGDWLSCLAHSSLAGSLRKISLIRCTLPALSTLNETVIGRFANLEEINLVGFELQAEELKIIAKKIATLRQAKKN